MKGQICYKILILERKNLEYDAVFILLLFSPSYASVKSAPTRGRRSHNWDTEHIFVNETLTIYGDDRIFETNYFNEARVFHRVPHLRPATMLVKLFYLTYFIKQHRVETHVHSKNSMMANARLIFG